MEKVKKKDRISEILPNLLAEIGLRVLAEVAFLALGHEEGNDVVS